MGNRIAIPFLNAIKFVEADPALFQQYFKKQFDNALFSDTIFDWQEQKCYPQKISVFDAYSFQFESNYDPLTLSIINVDGDAVLAFAAQRIRRNQYQTDYYIYEVDIDFSPLDPGFYYMQFVTGSDGGKAFVSEPIQIIDDISNTVLIEYANAKFYGDVVFETGITMSFRAEGFIWNFQPGSKDVIYEDQVLNNTMLSSIPFRTWKLFIGSSEGVPDWLIDKVNRMLGCDSLRIDGKFFVKADGAKWEQKEEENYPMRGWSIDLREELNRMSAIFDNDSPNNKKLLVAYNIESKGFGDTSDNAGSNVIVLTEVE